MERICSNCRAVLAKETKADWCPACGGALVVREELSEISGEKVIPQEVDRREIDHRGILLPRRFPVGGVITPQ